MFDELLKIHLSYKERQLISSKDLEEQLLSKLLETWKGFVSRLPQAFEPAIAIPALEEFARLGFDRFNEYGEPLIADTEFRITTEFEEGMNSPGILWDRLTILNCKYLFTAPDSVHHKPALHKNLGNVMAELKSVMKALSHALPARNILLAKEATNRQHAIVPLGESLWALQMSIHSVCVTTSHFSQKRIVFAIPPLRALNFFILSKCKGSSKNAYLDYRRCRIYW